MAPGSGPCEWTRWVSRARDQPRIPQRPLQPANPDIAAGAVEGRGRVVQLVGAPDDKRTRLMSGRRARSNSPERPKSDVGLL